MSTETIRRSSDESPTARTERSTIRPGVDREERTPTAEELEAIVYGVPHAQHSLFFAVCAAAGVAFVAMMVWAFGCIAAGTPASWPALLLAPASAGALRVAGRGSGLRFAVIGSAISLLACVGANIILAIGIIASAFDISYFSVAQHLSLGEYVVVLAGYTTLLDSGNYLIALALAAGIAFGRMPTMPTMMTRPTQRVHDDTTNPFSP